MQVRDIMTNDVCFCTPEASLQDVACMMAENDCGMIPLVEHNGSRRIIGVVTDRDIACRAVAEGRDPIRTRARDIATKPVICVRPDADFEELERQMEQHQIRRVLVIDGDGECCGVVAQADVARCAPEHDTAEIVREVSKPNPQPHS